MTSSRCCFLPVLQVPSQQEGEGVERLISGGERVNTRGWRRWSSIINTSFTETAVSMFPLPPDELSSCGTFVVSCVVFTGSCCTSASRGRRCHRRRTSCPNTSGSKTSASEPSTRRPVSRRDRYHTRNPPRPPVLHHLPQVLYLFS